jgi:hypothetical protein
MAPAQGEDVSGTPFVLFSRSQGEEKRPLRAAFPVQRVKSAYSPFASWRVSFSRMRADLPERSRR